MPQGLPAAASVALLALAALLALPLAAAQVPTLPPGPSGAPMAGVDVQATPQSVAVSLDHSGTAKVVVRNTASPTGLEPFDQPRTVTLGLGDMPVGWTARLSQTEFHLRPGASGESTLTVSVTAEARVDSASATVTAKMFALGVNQVPVAGPQADPDATAATVVKASRSDSVTRDVLETVGPYIWVVLLGLVAAVVLAVSVLAANRRVAVRLSSPEAEQAVAAGGRTTFPLRVHNITKQQDTVFLRASPLAEGWAAYLPTPQLDLEPGQQEEVSVVVVSPKEAEAGAHQAVDVTATSALAPRRPATMRLDATVAAARKKG
ncbi:MAG: hypothetical protein ABR562_05240 [Thermoplasmatota archaeon]